MTELDKIKNMYKRNSSPIFEVYENAYILPRKYINGGPGWGLGGVLKTDKSFVELSAYHGGWVDQGGFYNFDESEYCNDEVIYMGLFFKHWGHYLIDLIPRLWYPTINNYNAKNMKIVYIGEDEIKGNYLELLQLMGIQESQLIHITKPTCFKKIIVPEYSCRPCIWYTDEYVKMFDIISNNALDGYIVPKNLKDINNVYFSRCSFGKANKTEFGEKMIEDIYKFNGFTILYPEKLSLKDQIYIWNNSQKIACLNGSIPLNVVFTMNNNLKLDVLNKTSLLHLNLYFELLVRKVNNQHIDVYSEPFKGIPKSLGEGPFLLMLTKNFKQYLNNNGYICNISKLRVIYNNCLNYLKYCYYVVNPIEKIKIFIYKIVHK